MNKEESLKKAEQRKILLEKNRKKTRQRAIFSFIIIAIISIGFFMITFGGNVSTLDDRTINESTVKSKDEVIIPLSDISNEVKFYSYDSDGVKIKYFAVRDSEGGVRVALDACDLCFNEKKGYRQIGDIMQCINCGNQYPINGLGTENKYGGCWPSYLPIDVNDEDIIIKISDLESKRFMFS
jgi:uncharacterized membrane protein